MVVSMELQSNLISPSIAWPQAGRKNEFSSLKLCGYVRSGGSNNHKLALALYRFLDERIMYRLGFGMDVKRAEQIRGENR